MDTLTESYLRSIHPRGPGAAGLLRPGTTHHGGVGSTLSRDVDCISVRLTIEREVRVSVYSGNDVSIDREGGNMTHTDADAVRTLEESTPVRDAAEPIMDEDERSMAFAQTGDSTNHVVSLEIAVWSSVTSNQTIHGKHTS